MTVVSLSGVLLAAFVPTFLKHVRLSKIAEATEQLEALHRATAAYYARTHRAHGGQLRGCLPEGAGSAAGVPSPEPVAVDFAATETPGHETWVALGQAGPQNQRYAYSIIVPQPGCGPRTPGQPVVTFRAEGDLDGDGVRSVLERSAAVSSQHGLVPVPPLRIERRVE